LYLATLFFVPSYTGTTRVRQLKPAPTHMRCWPMTRDILHSTGALNMEHTLEGQLLLLHDHGKAIIATL